jgi:hypothetical protein
MNNLIGKLAVLIFLIFSINISALSKSTLYLFFSMPSSGPNVEAQISFNDVDVFSMLNNKKVTCDFDSQGNLKISFSVQSQNGSLQLNIEDGKKYYVRIKNENSQEPTFVIEQLSEKEGANACYSYRYQAISNFKEDTSKNIFIGNAVKNISKVTSTGQIKTGNNILFDQEFEWKLKPRFSEIKVFSHDLMALSENNKWGYADKNGNWVIKPTFNKAENFSEELAAVKLQSVNLYGLNEYSWGYIDKTGKFKIQAKFTEALHFNEGMAAVQDDHEWGFIDKNGELIIPLKFDMVESFSQGLAAVKKNNKWGFIDKTGNWVIKASYEEANGFCEGLALVKEKGEWGFIDATGKWIISPQFSDAVSFDDGIASAQFKGLWGFIDKNGSWIIKPQFSSVGNFSEGLAAAQLNGNWGFINNSGDWVLEPKFYDIRSFENGIAGVKINIKWGFMDKTGNLVVTPQFDDIHNLDHNKMVAVKQINKWGFISITSITAIIKREVEEKITNWQKKDEFENSVEYRSRVNEQTRNTKVQEYTEEIIKVMKKEYSQRIDWRELQLDEYDADHETFRVKSSKLGDFIISVPKTEGKLFKEYWGEMNFSNADFFIQSEKFVLAKVTILNPVNSKKYLYDSKNRTDYEIRDIIYDPIIYDEDLIPNETAQNNSNISKKNVTVIPSDIDLNIPLNKFQNTQTFAVVIGNENYKNEIKVEFAKNDARIFKEYLIKALGIPEKQIHLKEDATYADMLGEIDWLTNIGKAFGNDAKIIFYYAGHGMPENETKNAYLLPVDGRASQVKIAVSTNELYSSLSQCGAVQATVFLDACFSGATRDGMMLASGRGVIMKPKENSFTGNLVVFSAVSGEQTAHPYKEKKHGLFSYFLMKKLQETSGNVTYKELDEYISKNVNQVSAIEGKGNVQTPKVNVSADVQDKWMNWKLK